MSIIDCGWFPVILCFCMGGRRVSGVPLNYYMTGHASATSAHAAVHSIPKYKKGNCRSFFIFRDTNTGGAEVPLSCNNIRWNTQNLLYATNTKNIIYMQNKYYNLKLWCGGE